jgi:flavin-dependent dehydrogenase
LQSDAGTPDASESYDVVIVGAGVAGALIANPTLTLAALALRTAGVIAADSGLRAGTPTASPTP